MMNGKWITVVAMLVVTSSLTAVAQQTAGRMSLPTSGGAYGIGRISYSLTDNSRSEPLSQVPGHGAK